ncbi:unnamed protein product [Sphagnum troendelagicum]
MAARMMDDRHPMVMMSMQLMEGRQAIIVATSECQGRCKSSIQGIENFISLSEFIIRMVARFLIPYGIGPSRENHSIEPSPKARTQDHCAKQSRKELRSAKSRLRLCFSVATFSSVIQQRMLATTAQTTIKPAPYASITGDNSERDGESQSERERETSGATEETRLPQVAPAAKLRDAALPLAASHESHDLRGLTAYPRTTLPPNFERPQRSVGGETLD